MFARHIAHQRQRPLLGHRARKTKGLLSQGLGRRGHPVEQLLARQRGQQLAFLRLAAHHHVERDLHSQYPGQALRSTGAGNQAQLDLRQRDIATRRRNAVVATQSQFKPSSHGDRMHSRHDRLGRILYRQYHAQQVGLLQRLGRSEFLDVGAARESLPRTANDDHLHRRVGHRLGQAISNGHARRKPEAIHGRVVQGDYRHVAMDFVLSAHVFSLRKRMLVKIERSFFLELAIVGPANAWHT